MLESGSLGSEIRHALEVERRRVEHAGAMATGRLDDRLRERVRAQEDVGAGAERRR